MEEGYQEAAAAVRSWARRSGLPQTTAPLTRPVPLMPPLARAVEWRGRGPVRRGAIAQTVLGRLPRGPFHPSDLAPALRRLSLSGMFDSAWPALTDRGDSTVLSFDVRERAAFSIGPAFHINNDDGASVHLGMTLRPLSGPLPSLARIGWGVRPLGWDVNGSLEPYALEHGNPGWFMRGRYHEMRTRIIEGGEEVSTLRTHRLEALGGGQIGFAGRQVVQAGAGYADISRPSPGWQGLLVAARTQSLAGAERTVEAEWAAGDGGYSRVKVAVDVDMRYRALVVTPGVRFGAVDGEAPPDALVGLGGPHSLSGLRHDEWLGRTAGAFSLELAIEAQRQARLYIAAQSGRVNDAVSGVDLGEDPVSGIGVGGEVDLPTGPLRIEYGACTAGRRRLDIMLGTRF